jgi:hypothetical protein
MVGADECIRQAVEMLRRALAADRDRDRQTFLSLAVSWCNLAAEMEAAVPPIAVQENIPPFVD